MSKPFIVFDLETTGTDIAKDRIVEIGFVKTFPNGDREVKVRKINPLMPIPKDASDVHGILDEHVKDCSTFKEIAKSLHDTLDGCDIGGFNCKNFDIPLLIEEFLRSGIEWSLDGISVLDAYEIDQELNPRTLGGVYSRTFNKEFEDAHSALADSIATLEILGVQKQLLATLPGERNIGGTTQEISDYFFKKKKPYMFTREFYVDEDGIVKYNIGKDRGKCVLTYPSFMGWMLGQDFSKHTKNIIHKLTKR